MPRKPTPEPVILPVLPRGLGKSIGKQIEAHSLDPRLEKVQEFLEVRSHSLNSQKAYHQDLQCFLKWSKTDWPHVSSQQIVQFRRFLLDEAHLGPRSIQRVLTTLKRFYDWLVEAKYVPKNPVLALSSPSTDSQTRTSGKHNQSLTLGLTEEEVAKALHGCLESPFPHRDQALVAVLLNGLRVEEVTALNFGDYDGKAIKICSTRGTSELTLETETCQYLNAYLEERQQLGETALGESPLFVSYSRRNYGQRLSPWGIRDTLSTLSQKVNLDLHPQRFRQTFIVNLIQQGAKPETIIVLARFRSIQSLHPYFKQLTQICGSQPPLQRF